MTNYKDLYFKLLICTINAENEIQNQNYGTAAKLLEQGIQNCNHVQKYSHSKNHSAAAYVKRHLG